MPDSNHELCRTLPLDAAPPGLNKAQKRWRIAYTTIYSARVMLSLAREIISRRNHSEILLSQPYAALALDIEPPTSKRKFVSFSVSGVDKNKLVKLVKEKDRVSLGQLDGVEGVAAALGTDPAYGIRDDDQEIRKRQEIFGSNTYQKPPPKGLLHFVVEAFKDTTILILLVCTALALGFGIKEHGAKEGWYERGSIFAAVFLVVVVSAFSNFIQEAQFDKLSKISNNLKVDVIREGCRRPISIFGLVVGDVVCLKIGDQIPADGLFLTGHSLQVDESSMTGESNHVEVDSVRKPFLFSGSKVVDGNAQMLVASVGMNTIWGEMMSSSRGANERTPLQARLSKLTCSIAVVGLFVCFLVVVVTFVRCFTRPTSGSGFKKNTSPDGEVEKAILYAVEKIIISLLTIVVVAIPKGLPLAVAFTLAYSIKRIADQAMVRKLLACESMGLATVICTNKTGTLTLNEMEVTKFWVGKESIAKDSSNSIALRVLELFHQGVGLNTTETVSNSVSGSAPEISRSPTEEAILSWAESDLGMVMEKLKQNYNILHVETFNSEKKRSGVLVKKNADNTIHVHWKGAAEMILAMCSNYYDGNGETRSMEEGGRSEMEKIIEGMAASSLICIAFAHKEISEEETKGNDDRGNSCGQIKEDGLTLLGIVGLKNPCRPGVKKAVEACKSAGVEIKVITGDNIFTAKAIATECGILEEGGEVVEGLEFGSYTPEERMQKVDKIKVMARSSPFHKLLMVQCLKEKGHVVAVTGDDTNDAFALKEADIGLSMSIQATDVANESSDVVILDRGFASVVNVWTVGRLVRGNIQKFIQLQLSVNIVVLVISVVSAVAFNGEKCLTGVQLLWVNLVMETVGALALATDGPTEELMQKPPVNRDEPLITNIMWRNLVAQALYQIAILLVFQIQGESLFNVTPEVNHTLMFNTLVLCLALNMLNSRKLEKMNVFSGILKNRLFLGIVAIIVILQVVMVQFMRKSADTQNLNLWQWGVCILVAAFTLPIGCMMKLISVPDKHFLNYI